MKVSSTFSKVAGSRDSVPGRAPQSAELSFCSYKIRKGVQGGNPIKGFPPFIFRWCVCAVLLGGGRWPALPFDPISLVLAQRNGVEPPKKSAFFYLGISTIRVSATSRWIIRFSPDLGRGWCLPVAFYVCAVSLGRSRSPQLPIPPHFFALAQRNGVEPQRNALLGAATGDVRSRPPLPRTRSPNITADCVKLTLPGQLTNQPQVNLTHQFVPLGLRAEWERRAGPPR